MDQLRGSGRTTAQIKELKPGGVFIPAMGTFDYTRHLCRDLGRHDVKLMQFNPKNVNIFRGLRISSYAIDHALYDQLQTNFERGMYMYVENLLKVSVRPKPT